LKSFKEIKGHGRIVVLKEGVDGFKGEIHMPRWTGTIIASNGAGWNHVSVAPYKRNIIPTWEDMCMIKDICFGEDEWVVQYHPAKAEYVSNLRNCLHLWQPNDGREMPKPPSILAGIK